ncbi:MAG TPA: FecR domain-containing protein [Mesorhizobium sp.]|uniref:FecR family protein n=1 Tax=Mesorhizobium sp. TaxID=1871066 RepID=UPI002DDD4BFA|nr:FecR domain-containing protein [Mesorhizobium sp.]HEV2502753.1 FecR domain-containing protein [Mesorhizobium sp.]
MERDKPGRNDNEQGFVHPDPVTDAALDWFLLLQATPQDGALRAGLEAWRKADPAHAEAFAVVSGAWDLPEMDIVARDIASRGDRVRQVPVARHPARGRRWAGAVMALAAAVLLAVGIQQYPMLMLERQADYITATGARDVVTLPDGSLMTLNTGSAVTVDFEGRKRSVTLLQGEAYFDVVPDASRPFKVAAAFSEVEVKGTAFSVQTDSDQDTVVLERGHVDVTRLTQRADMASLEPGESITATATALSAVSKTDTATSLAWLQGRLVFQDKPFGAVLKQLGRYYGHAIVVADSRLEGLRVNGNYRLDDPERIVRSLATATGATVTRVPGGILILH